MEFDFEKHRVIGIVQNPHYANDNVKIKANAKIDEDDIKFKLSESRVIEIFKPHGNIFAFDFFKKFPYKEDEIIEFSVKPNSQPKDGHDEYVLNWLYSAFGTPVYPLKEFCVKNQSIDLSSVQIIGNYEDGLFYGITDKYIIGKFEVNNGVLSAVEIDIIFIWDIDSNEENLIKNKTFTRLIEEPINEF